VSFTGSTRAGRAVAELGGRHLKRVHLELGGNSALVVLDDADLDLAASAGAWGSFLHQGQICMTTGRHLVHERVADDYVARLAAKADHRDNARRHAPPERPPGGPVPERLPWERTTSGLLTVALEDLADRDGQRFDVEPVGRGLAMALAESADTHPDGPAGLLSHPEEDERAAGHVRALTALGGRALLERRRDVEEGDRAKAEELRAEAVAELRALREETKRELSELRPRAEASLEEMIRSKVADETTAQLSPRVVEAGTRLTARAEDAEARMAGIVAAAERRLEDRLAQLD